jgi:hypothetical protein
MSGLYPPTQSHWVIALAVSGQFLGLCRFRCTRLAVIDWAAAIAALDAGHLSCSGGEQRMLRLAASLASGIPVSLRDTLTGIDQHNIELVITAVLHAWGQRPEPEIP